jgi:cysteine dioxygenase
MKKISLPQFIDYLNERSEADFKGPLIDKYLGDHVIDQDQFLPFIYFREDTYGRNLVYRTSRFELLLLTWLPKQRTPIHDHAGQRCWMLVQSGTLAFRNYEPIRDGSRELCCVGPVATHAAGETVYIDDGIGIHSIANASSKPAVSVHLYAGPIPRCRIYDESAKRFEWKELEYFTRFDREASTAFPRSP